MKKKALSVVLIPLALIPFLGCQNATEKISDSEKELIIKEVRSEFDKVIAAANKHDADALLKQHWNSDEYMYVGHGNIARGWETVLKGFKSVHTNPKYQSFTLDMDQVMIRVIDREAVMVVADGYFNNFPTSEGPKSIKMALTGLWEKIDGQWLMTVGHESTQASLSFQ